MRDVNLAQSDPPLSDLTKRYRIFHEESAVFVPRSARGMYQELRGTGDTRIYAWGPQDGAFLLAVSTESPRRCAKLARIPGVRRYTGCVLRFPVSLLETVAEAVKAKKRVVLSEDERQRRSERMKALRGKSVKQAIPEAKSEAKEQSYTPGKGF